MDIEKYTNGKLYQFFDVFLKLIIWNILTIIIVCLAFAGPFLGFYYLKEGVFAGLLMIFGILLGIFVFIPSYCTIFSCIKLYKEEKESSTLSIYFIQLWDNFKSLYKAELIIFPIVVLTSFSMYFYNGIIGGEEIEITFITAVYQIGYTILLFVNVAIFLCFLNLPMTNGYFRMRTKTLMKFTLIMTFKHILKTLLFVVLIIAPLLIVVLVNWLIPFWMLVGLSLPTYAMYFLTRKDYWQLVNNSGVIKDEEDKFEKGEDYD